MNIHIKVIQTLSVLLIISFIAVTLSLPSQADNLPDGYITPIIAFEFAQTENDIYTLFGRDRSPISDEFKNKNDRGNYIDFIFMVIYSSFLFLLALKCYEIKKEKIFLMCALLALITLGGDISENIQLLSITAALPDGDFSKPLQLLQIFTWVKWLALSLVFALLSPFFFRAGRFGKIIGFSGIGCFFLGVAAYFTIPIVREAFALSTGIIFFLMIIFMFVRKEKFV